MPDALPHPPLFVPECYVDTALMRALLFDRREYINHQHGIGNAGRLMKKQAADYGAARRVVGMVDRDKKFDEQPYLDAFQPPDRVRPEEHATHHVLTHPTVASQLLIVLNPACDAWLFEAARAAGIELAQYGLPTTFAEFIAFCKHRGVANIPELRALLADIRRAYPPSIKSWLKRWRRW